MKKITLMIVAFGLAGAASAGVILGDVLAIDFGGTATSTTNYNHSTHAVSTGNVADLIRLSDGDPTGVGFTLAGSSQDNSNYIAGNGGNTTDSSIFADGIIANLNNGASGNPTLMTLTFSNLEDTLTYDLVVGSTRADDQVNAQNFIASWTAGDTTITTSGRPTLGTNPGGYVSFTGLASSGGSLVITVDGANQYSPVAQLELTAVPEPATLGLVVAMGGGLLWLRRVFTV